MRAPVVVSASAVLVGTIVGAGIFALPAATARAGLPPTLLLLALLGGTVFLLHAMYGEVVLRTPTKQRLPGYVGLYVGPRAARVATFSSIVGGLGALLAYIVLAEQFLRLLAPAILPPLWGGIAFWAVLSLAVILGMKTVARIELAMSLFLIATMAVIVIAAAPRVSAAPLRDVGSFGDVAALWGVLLFALWGIAAIPEMRDLFDRDARGLSQAILWGSMLPALLYLVFIILVVGAFGEDARGDLGELVARLGSFVFGAFLLFGIAAVATSFLVLGSYLIDLLRYDFRMRRVIAAGVLALPPLAFLAGWRDLILVVAVVGGILGAADGTMIALVWRRARRIAAAPRPAYALAVPPWIAYAMMALLLLGGLFDFSVSLRRLLW